MNRLVIVKERDREYEQDTDARSTCIKTSRWQVRLLFRTVIYEAQTEEPPIRTSGRDPRITCRSVTAERSSLALLEEQIFDLDGDSSASRQIIDSALSIC